MTDTDKLRRLAERLTRRVDRVVHTPLGPFTVRNSRLLNPDGAEAADTILALIAENEAQEAKLKIATEALGEYAEPLGFFGSGKARYALVRIKETQA